MIVNCVNRRYKTLNSIGYYLEEFLLIAGKDKKYIIDIMIYKKIKTILLEEKKERPFMDVPKEEKRLMINISSCLEKNVTDLALDNLQELSSVLIAKDKVNKRYEKTNKWSVPLAYIGIAVSLIFGIYTVWCSLNKETKTTQTEIVELGQHQTIDSFVE